MFSLNLLPPEIKEEIAYSKKNARILKYLGFSLSGFILIFAFFFGLGLAIKNKQSVYEVEKTSAQRILETSKDTQAKANDLSERLKLIKKLKDGRTDWNAIFEALSANTPTGVQLASIDISTEKNSRVKITGLAKTDRDIALFKDLLAQSKVFEYVDIENISEASDPTGGNQPTKSFMINLNLEGAKK
jgi:Tfp pilus assembly protein PilN